MRNSVIIVLSAIVLMAEALAAHAEVGGPVIQPAVGTANPAPPAAGSDVGTPQPQKPALGGNSALGTNGNAIDNQTAGPVTTGNDTSTAAPGGQAESSKNGALSSPPNGASPPNGTKPPDGKPVHADRKKPTTAMESETPK
jgi:hypothetical protein